jgi:hypothetical protein
LFTTGPLAEPIHPSFFDVVLPTVEKSAHEQPAPFCLAKMT